ncbi:MAG: hypothetical protein GF313_00910, partial [Caldithrix sp.]|nr:hypothetical protein [Caldithrix sp.]
MKRLITIMVLLVMILSTVQITNAQYKAGSKYSGVGIPFFQVVLHRMFTEDFEKNRLEIISQFLYDDLTFV